MCVCGSFSKLRHGPLPHTDPKLPPLAVSPPTQLSRETHEFRGGPPLGSAQPAVALWAPRAIMPATHAAPFLVTPRRHSPWRLCRCDRVALPEFSACIPAPIFPLPSLHSRPLHFWRHCTPFLPAPSCSLRFVCRHAVTLPFSSRVLVLTSLRARASSCG